MTRPPPRPSPAYPRRLALVISAAFVGLLAAVALVDAGHWWLRGPAPGGTQQPLPGGSDGWLRGGISSALERNLQNGSAFANVVRPLWNEARLAALDDGGRNVVVGRDGWLYLASDVRPPRDTPRLQREYAAHVEAGVLAMRSLGARTLFVLVPDKSSLAVEHLPAGLRATPSSYPGLREQMLARDIDCPDLLGWMRGGPEIAWYRRDDTHWTLAGVERIATLLACAVRARVGTDAMAPAQPQARLSAWPAFRGIRPDLLSGLGLTPNSRAWRGLVDPEHGRVLGVPRSDSAPRIALAGTSMSFKQLREALCVELGVEIANYAQAGAGTSGKFVEALLDFASGRAPTPELLIWETVERYGREGPCLTFAGLPSALERVYAARWSPWRELSAGEPLRRDLATLARVPLEGESLPRRRDTWEVRRFEGGFVLPGNGTFALTFEARAAGTALIAARLENRAWVDAVLRPIEPGSRRLPLVGADWITSFELALRASSGAELAADGFGLDSAWRASGSCDARALPAPGNFELALGVPSTAELAGLAALQFDLVAERAGDALLRVGEGPALQFPLPAGAQRCVVPLRRALADTGNGKHGAVLELPAGARLAGPVERLELTEIAR
ncbi:MAG: hypothetical protein FJ299_04735 [Planctomycetes bacterium]|nr:hypothetical protein [Planctomycetota bacterium]